MDKSYKSSSELSKKSKRSRSRSPIDKKDDKYHRKHHSKEDYKKRSRKSSSSSISDDDQHKSKNAPPPPRISMNFNRSNVSKPASVGGIQIKLNTQPKVVPLVQKSTKISNIFNDDNDSEPEEMPAEAKMRMRNIGKDTPTSSGPNSFGKTKQGFIDTKKIFERKLKQMADEISND